MKNSSCFFKNLECEYFPCHKGLGEDFNCMFCYCPLYKMENCGGKFTLTKEGIKDCSDCLFPHKSESYNIIMSKLKQP